MWGFQDIIPISFEYQDKIVAYVLCHMSSDQNTKFHLNVNSTINVQETENCRIKRNKTIP